MICGCGATRTSSNVGHRANYLVVSIGRAVETVRDSRNFEQFIEKISVCRCESEIDIRSLKSLFY